MMTPVFRVLLVVISLTTVLGMMRKIRQAKVQIEASVYWVVVGLVLVVFSLFPPVADAMAGMLGIYSTPNFLFLFVIFLLMVKLFSMSIYVSQLESRIKEIVQKMALDDYDKKAENDERET